MSCCRRIVQLCRDCLLIVYQFAADAKAAGAASVVTQGTTPQESDMRLVMNLFLGPLIYSSNNANVVMVIQRRSRYLSRVPGV